MLRLIVRIVSGAVNGVLNLVARASNAMEESYRRHLERENAMVVTVIIAAFRQEMTDLGFSGEWFKAARAISVETIDEIAARAFLILSERGGRHADVFPSGISLSFGKAAEIFQAIKQEATEDEVPMYAIIATLARVKIGNAPMNPSLQEAYATLYGAAGGADGNQTH